MAILHVRDVPNDLYSNLKQLAEANHRSLSAEIIVLLKHAMGQAQVLQDQLDILQKSKQIYAASRPLQSGEETSTDWLREDRAR